MINLTLRIPRYWGSYSASYPAGGSGSSADVAYDVANLQEASRQALGVASQASAPRAVASQASAAKAVFAPQQQTRSTLDSKFL